jgi:GrpB-like predicted nucleotidyltransferase (UPF0157 family)
MEGLNQHIDYDLAAKFLAGECNQDEKHVFQSWLDATPSNQEEFEELKKVMTADYSEQNVNLDLAWESVNNDIGQ